MARLSTVCAWIFCYALFGFLLGQIFIQVNPVTISMFADVVFLLIGAHFYKRLYFDEFSNELNRYERFSAVWRSVFLFVLWFCVYILGNVIAAFVPDPAMEAYVAVQSEYRLPFAVLTIAIAPVVEEVMFRGVSYLLLRRCA